MCLTKSSNVFVSYYLEEIKYENEKNTVFLIYCF